MSEREEIIEAMVEAGMSPEEAEDTQAAAERIAASKRAQAAEDRTIATSEGVVIAEQRHIEIGEQRLSSDEIVSAWRKGRISRKVAEGLMRELDR